VRLAAPSRSDIFESISLSAASREPFTAIMFASVTIRQARARVRAAITIGPGSWIEPAKHNGSERPGITPLYNQTFFGCIVNRDYLIN